MIQIKKKDGMHIEIRDYIGDLLNKGLTIKETADLMNLNVGSRYTKYSAKWYKYCFFAKRNQEKAIEKHPDLYSRAGKIAQQKHPWLGHELGKTYGSIAGKKRIQKLREQDKLSSYASFMAKRLQKINPNHSRLNMEKAHKTMKQKGTFNEHQRKAALKCIEKNPGQLKEMSKIAHEKYPLALLALESRRKNYPYEFMGCFFDSDSERKLCKLFVETGLMEKPKEGTNTHIKIGKKHIDFFLKNKVFAEYHPPRKFGRKIETLKEYYNERRKILDENGYGGYPLVIFDRLRDEKAKLERIRSLIDKT